MLGAVVVCSDRTGSKGTYGRVIPEGMDVAWDDYVAGN